jgi:hypothetical protein
LENERNESNAKAEALRYSIPASQIEAGARARFMQEHPQFAANLFKQGPARAACPKPVRLLTDILDMPYVRQRGAGMAVIAQILVLRQDLTAEQIAEINSRLVALCKAKPPELLPYSIHPEGRQHPTYGQLLYAETLPENVTKSILDWALSTRNVSSFSVGEALTLVGPVPAAAINWQDRQTYKQRLALVVKLNVPVERRDATNTRLVALLAKNTAVVFSGEPQVVYIKQSTFDEDFPLGLQNALVAENPTQAMADLNPFRAIGDAHRRIAIGLRSQLPILRNNVTEGQWDTALGVGGGLSEKFLTMDARPGHWGATGAIGSSEYVPLSDWIKYVFTEAGGKHVNSLISTVINASVNYLPIERNEDKKVTRYRVSDYENICKVYSICHTINKLQPDSLRERIKTKFGWAR